MREAGPSPHPPSRRRAPRVRVERLEGPPHLEISDVADLFPDDFRTTPGTERTAACSSCRTLTSAHHARRGDSTSRSTSSFLGGYGLGAYLMWKHYPPGADPLAPEACFAIVSGLLTGARTPFSGRHPDRRQVAAHRDVGRLELGRQRARASCAAPATTRCS